ncbi:iron ABC transporter substrate-binding protein [Leucobacter chromiiresistens]|uniref:Iron ABC transporter substrate-binding protein n=1 Tax=Leucobacter chromiiresistens TaxID=1079994 RepID=A0A147EN77_9MICO|nr:iron ABC transporter substrate-binding protein [Leucobacter chromiiresistens]
MSSHVSTLKLRSAALTALAATAAFALSACAPAAEAESEPAASGATAVTITDNHGEVEVPVNPERVVALDNHVFETLDEWDVPLVAAPKGIMGTAWPDYTDDPEIADVGTHREPNLEAIVAAQPDLIIGGYRFSESYDTIVEQNPDATVIEIDPRDGEDPMDELKRETEILGQIFDREDEAAELVSELDQSIADAKQAYNGSDSVIGLITSGGKIEFAAPVTGRSVGPVFSALDLRPAIEQEAEDTSHGDDISVEAIAEANPDWIVVLDRDASFAEPEPGAVPADELIAGSEALQGVTAVAKDQVVYLDSDFYLTEDIQAYTELYEQIQEAFAGA